VCKSMSFMGGIMYGRDHKWGVQNESKYGPL